MFGLRTATALASAFVLGSATTNVLFPAPTPGEATLDQQLVHIAQLDSSQQLLDLTKATQDRWQTSHFTKKKQDNTTCPTYGESQWTGTVNVREGRDLFYWYFDSRNDPDNDPLILWINGGPGTSSMMGLFTEMGPCWLNPNTTKAQPNPWSWNNNASVLFLDQPAGAGLSRLASGFAVPSSDQDAAKDFLQFLNIFFTDIFPEKKTRRMHIAAESYGGHYGPIYIKHVLDSQRQGLTSFEGNLASLILINSLIDWYGYFLGVYDFLCKEREKVGLLNATACEFIARNMPEQKRLARKCDIAYGGKECRAAFDHGMTTISAPFLDLVKADNRYMANINKTCIPTSYYPFCADPDIGNLTEFMNRGWVKTAVDKPPEFIYQDYNMDIQAAFREDGAFYNPTTKELAFVLEAGIRVMVMNGNLDYVVNTPGNVLEYDRLHWTGHAEYRAKKWQPLPETVAATGAWKATHDGRLAFLAVDRAGHTVPSYVRKGSLDIIQEWMRGGWRM